MKDRKEYFKAWYAAHKEEHKTYMKAYNKAHRERLNEYKKAYQKAHKEQVKATLKAYYQANKDQRKAYQKAYNQEHKKERQEYFKENKEQINAYKKAYHKTDVNSLGQTKNSIRHKSWQILKQMNLKIPGYEIHHCFGYEDPSKFIYISKELHLKIHQYLRDNNIVSDSDHYEYIKHLLDDNVVKFGI